MGGFDGLNPELTRRLQELMQAGAAAGHQISPGSGRRSVDEQIALRHKNGCPDVWKSPASSCRVPTAIPGRSNHNHGLAMDLSYGSDEAAAWANANAGNFGLHFPVKGENWHAEMIDDDGSHAPVQEAQQQGAIGFDVNWMEEQRNPEDELTSRLNAIMETLGSGVEPIEEPDDVMDPNQIAQDITAIPSDKEMTRQHQVQMPGGGVMPGGGTGGGSFDGDVPPPGYNPPGEGVDRWRDVAIAALKYTGQDPGQVDILLRRMNQESGGDPGAVNNWDSNAKRGDPTTGLMQNIPSAFNERAKELADRGITDGFANIVASIRYTLGRYGSLAAGYNKRGGY